MISKSSQKKETHKDGAQMSLFEHLGELRSRLVRICIVLFICIIASYAFRKEILDVFRAPVMEPLRKYSTETLAEPKELIKTSSLLDSSYNCQCSPIESKNSSVGSGGETVTTNPTKSSALSLNCHCEPSAVNHLSEKASPPSGNNSYGAMVFIGLPELFFAQLKIAFFAGLFLTFPHILIEFWGFVGPALYRNEKKFFWVFALFTFVCFTGGALFGYFIVFPFGFEFFLSLTEPGEIIPSLSIGEYLSFALKLLFAFGIVFELPLAVLLLSRMGIVTPEWLLKNSKYALLIFFATAAILTPPDPFTMLLMAVPLIILYAISVLISYVTVNRRRVKARKVEKEK